MFTKGGVKVAELFLEGVSSCRNPILFDLCPPTRNYGDFNPPEVSRTEVDPFSALIFGFYLSDLFQPFPVMTLYMKAFPLPGRYEWFH